MEQLARYTMRYQESDLHLGLSSSLTSASNPNRLSLLLYSIQTLLRSLTSEIATVFETFVTKAGFMFGLADRGNKIKVNSVWIMF